MSLRDRALPFLITVAAIGGWELTSQLGWVNPILVSSPTRIARASLTLLGSPLIARDVAYSASVFATAVVIASTWGTALGSFIGWSPLAHRVIHPLLVALNAIPKIALMPLIVLWFGIGRPSGIFLATLMASFPVVIATSSGFSALERDHVRVARAFGAGRWHTLKSVVLPGVLPYAVSGLRVGTSYALVGVLIAEFFASSRGIGHRMIAYMASFEVDAFFVCLMLVAGFALCCASLLRYAEIRMSAWRPEAFESAEP